MQIGLLGLGRMGGNMTARLLRAGYKVVVFDRHPERIEAAVQEGGVAASSLADIVSKLPGRRVVWLMIASGHPVDTAISELTGLLAPGDIIIDGGNSFYKDSIRRAEALRPSGIHYIDAGTSGGVWGLENGYCLMVGGDSEPVSFCEPVFRSLAPENGYLHAGPSGAGHFVKMVHNGIEYGMMQAYAEGFEILERAPFKLNLPEISRLWEHGSVVRSWLLELATAALSQDPELARVKPWVADSGEGRWTVDQAVETGVPAYAIAASLFARFASRDDSGFGLRLLSALRNQFGGHPVKSE